MKLRIPIFSVAAAIVLLLTVFVLNAQEMVPQTPLAKETLVAVPAPSTMIGRDQLVLSLPGKNALDGGQSLPNQNSHQPAYRITTSADDPQCDTGFDGYLNLEDMDIFPSLAVEGDNMAWSFENVGRIDFFGVQYNNELWITDDGLVFFNSQNYGRSWVPQHIADPDLPNNVIAPLWQDTEIIQDRATNRGVSVAQSPDIVVVEFDDLQLVGDPKNRYDMEIIMRRNVDHTQGVYEIVFAYDNLNGTLAGPLTIGLENWGGTNAAALINRGDATGVIENGFMVCFDAVVGVPPTDAPPDVQASDGDHSDMVHVSWTGVEEATIYEVYRAESVGDEKSKLGHSNEPYFHDVTAVPGTTYAYWVTTCNTYGCSEHSEYDTGWRAMPHVGLPISHFLPVLMSKQ